jgi:hypothetical protein
MPDYTFCVTHIIDRDVTERFGAVVHFGDIDPGKEAARVLLAAKVRRPTTTSVSVGNYNPAECGEISAENRYEVDADPETVARLVSAIGSGDLEGTAVTAVEIAAGITVKTVAEVGRGASVLPQK